MWELLSRTKQNCWRVWVTLAPGVLLLTLLQTLLARFGSITGFVWLWTGLLLLPGFSVLFVTVLKDRRTAWLVPREVHLTLWLGSLLYLVAILVIILLEGLATNQGRSIYDYRMLALLWMLPMQLLLLVGYGLIFYKKEPLFQPDAQSIQRFASATAQKWTEAAAGLKKDCFDLVAKGRLEVALERAHHDMAATGVGDLNHLTLLRSQLSEVRRQTNQGLIEREKGQVTINRITLAFMNLLHTIPKTA